MRLATKLFLFVGALLLAICVAIYLVPAYISSKELMISRTEYLETIEKQRADDHNHHLAWLTEMVGSVEGRIDSYLLMVNGRPRLKEALAGEGENQPKGIWYAQTHLLSVGSDLDLLQVSRGKEADAIINLGNTQLYRAKLFPIEQDMAWVLLHVSDPGEPLRDLELMGIWIPSSMQQVATNIPSKPPTDSLELFLLFDPLDLFEKGDHFAALLSQKGEAIAKVSLPGVPHAGAVAVELLKRLVAAGKYLEKTYGTDYPQNIERLKSYLGSIGTEAKDLPLSQLLAVQEEFRETGIQHSPYASLIKRPGTAQDELIERSFGMQLGRLVRSANEVELVGALGLLTAVGDLWVSPLSDRAPLGAARVAPRLGIGSAVLTADVFSEDLIYDIQELFEKSPPINPAVPIASDFGLAMQKDSDTVSVVNGLRIGEGVYLTIGSSLNRLVARMHEVTGEPTILVYDNRVIRHDDGKHPLDQQMIDTINKRPEIFAKDNGFVEINGVEYYYSNYQPKPEWPLRWVTIKSAKEVLASTIAFEERSKELAQTLSFHIIIAAIGVFILALIALELIARRFTRPIRILAKATQRVREGNYEDVPLPTIKKGTKNEIAVLSHSFREMVRGLADREKIRSVLDKVVSKEIAHEILHGQVDLGGQVKQVTVLFADVRNFTKITENLPPEEVITFVNSFMTIMTEEIERHLGVVDKYMGDEVMALFGAPVEHPLSALQAVLTALLIKKRIEECNKERKEQGLFTAEVGLGIHCGPMVAGNMGAKDRLNYTVLGANVNLASRLCDEAKGGQILVSKEVLDAARVSSVVDAQAHEPIALKGFSEPVPVFELTSLKGGFFLGDLSDEATQKGEDA